MDFSCSPASFRRSRLRSRSVVFATFAALLFWAANAHGEPLLGFDLAMSSKLAFKKAEEMGLQIVEKGVRKDGRKQTVFKGAAVDIAAKGKNAKTRLSFFKDKIETVTVLIEDAGKEDALAFENFLHGRYGKPDIDEEVLSFRVKSWNLPDSKLVLSHSDGGVLKLAHTHLETRKERRERDLARKKLKDKRHPVQKMIDGDFSKPDYR